MIEPRLRAGLGTTELPWLRALHHFCFAGYQRADRLEWGNLRVLNHSELVPGAATQPSLHSGTEFLLFAEDDVDIVRGDGRKIRVAAGDMIAIFTGNGIEFGIANPANHPARVTTLWLTGTSSGGRALVRKPIPLRRTGGFVASGLGGDRTELTLRAPARLTHVNLRRGEQLDSALCSPAAYVVVLHGSLRLKDHVI